MVKAIYKKEMALYFLTPFGYLFLGFFLLATGLVFTIYNIIGAKSDLYGMFGILNYICIFLFPILTMRIWAEEKKNYTDRLLITSPIKTSSIIIGKYLAALTVFVIALSVTSLYSLIILLFSQLSAGTVLASYLGFILLGAAYISICFFGSSLSGSQMGSIIISFGFLISFMLIGFLASIFPIPTVQKILNWLAIINNFDKISIGVLKVGPVYYYISIVIFFIYLTIVFSENKQKYKKKSKRNDPVQLIFLLGILVLSNLIVNELPWAYDMTTDKLFTLSEYTLETLDNLEEPVNITVLADAEKNNSMIDELLNKYEDTNSDLIHLIFIDADKDPLAVKQFDREYLGLANGNIIFESGGRMQRVHDFELVSENEFAPGKSFEGERLFTGAILNVTTVDIPKIHFSRGHQEDRLDNELSNLKKRIVGEAHQAEQINLTTDNLSPDEVLIIASPKRDLDAFEVQILEKFLSEGGRLMILIDLLNPETKMDNLKSLLKDYGIIAKANFIVEEDKQQIYANNKMVIIPEYSNSEIVDMIRSRKLSIVLPYPGHLERSPEALKNITIESLLHSSEKSWIRYDWSDATERKSDNDLSGPADLAYSVKIDNTDLKMPAAKMIVIYNGEFTDNEMVNYQANFDFFMNALNWLEDRDNTLTIRPRVIDANRLILPGMLFIIFIILCTTIIPVLFFFLSMYIWMKRKNL